MTTSTELQRLCDELTEIMPPPHRPNGLNFIVEGTGRWTVGRAGAGLYAVHATYDDSRGGTVEVRLENEITGYGPAVTTALRFMLSIATAHTHQWIRVPG